jgi:hypothetical protein
MDIRLDCRDWKAQAQAGRLVVSGVCTFPTPGYSVELVPQPSGINPWMAMFKVLAHPPAATTTEVVTDVPVEWSGPMPCPGGCREVDVEGLATLPVEGG